MRSVVPFLVVLAACSEEGAPDVLAELQARSVGPVQASSHDDGRLASFHAAIPITGPAEDAVIGLLDDLAPAMGLDGARFDVERVRQGVSGTWVRVTESHGGFPVLDGDAVMRVDQGVVRAGRLDLHAATEVDPMVVVDADEAVLLAREVLADGEREAMAPAVETGWLEDRLVHRVSVVVEGGADWRVVVDATTGELVDAIDLRHFDTGHGYVFDPNPEAVTGQNIADNNDRDSATLTNARSWVELPRLDGSGYLRGDWVDARQQGRANEATLSYDYTRSDDRFEEVNVYFHLDRTQNHLQELGFVDANARRQVVVVNGSFMDNAWYTPSTREITTGTGGVDDGEDADVVIHEYGHALQDDQGTYNYGDAPSLGEGFGDYLSSSVTNAYANVANDPLCMGEWDASSFGMACIRRLDSRKHYPERWQTGGFADPHANGELWSAALWRAREELGADVMDTIVVESQFGVPANPTVAESVDELLVAAEALYGHPTREIVKRAMIEQGLSRELSPPATYTQVQTVVNTVLSHVRDAQQHYGNNKDLEAVYTHPGANALSVHFYGVETQTGHDYVYVYDGEGNLYQVLDGLQTDFDSVQVPGDTIRIRLVTDGGGVKRGFHATSVNVY
ncbi:MAG: M36 family metallopeptidase [Alphaproteobacteria bacterium]|nr:M36 family metallopeptidase [Alphaproteobacteria bacterium]